MGKNKTRRGCEKKRKERIRIDEERRKERERQKAYDEALRRQIENNR